MSLRRLSQLIEALHAPVYFAPEPAAAYAELGLRGYWRGYFAGRCAALWLAEPATQATRVTELLGGFAPAMVEQALPSVWEITTPAQAYQARRDAAGAALTRLAGNQLPRTQMILKDLGKRVLGHLDQAPLAAAEAAQPEPGERGACVWHWATVLRELRGDLHLAAVREAGMSWPKMHVLIEPTGRLDPLQRELRGWSEEEWTTARAELTAAGLYDTPAGTELIDAIEAETDQRLEAALGKVPVLSLIGFLRPCAALAIVDVPFPNAMGLPRFLD